MDRISYTRIDKQSIYEIYRSCRLCGGGAGYKMPIVQNVIDLDTNGVELKQKIQECLRIEVHQDDKMPPLICELCVDKVNDFYEFMEICRQTNKRTRMRLGLPLQAPKKSASDSGDCILGVTEPIYETEDDNEPLSKQVRGAKRREIKKEKVDEPEPLSKLAKKHFGKKNVNVKKEPELKIKTEKVKKVSGAEGVRSPPPARSTRQLGDNTKLANLKNAKVKSSPQPVKTSLKRELKELLDVKIQYKDDEPIRAKRAREKEIVVKKKPEKAEKRQEKTEKKPDKTDKKLEKSDKKPLVEKNAEVPAKKAKLSLSPKPAKSPLKPKAAAALPCAVCAAQLRSAQGLAAHLKAHVVTFTAEKLACNPCGEWFSTNEEASSHHKKHKTKPYRCRYCYSVFKLLSDYNGHFVEENCQPYTEVADKQCAACWRPQPTQRLLELHRCPGPDGRPGGKCLKCNRVYTLLKNLKKHEATCTFRKKGDVIVDPKVQRRLRDARIHLMKCDDLLTKVKGDSYDISDVDSNFGFDYKYMYPYRYRVKSEPTTGYDAMVAIGDEIKEYYSRDYIHWDSDHSDTDVDEKKRKVDSLTVITLKTIFSNKLLGKVPRRRRKVNEKAFDNNYFDMSKDIDSIIKNLDNVKYKNDSADDSDCSESIFGPFKSNEAVSENAFEYLLGENDSQDTEKNFVLFSGSGGIKDSTDLGKVDDSHINNTSDSQVNSDNDSSVNKDEDKLKDSPVKEHSELESKENDYTSTDISVNHEYTLNGDAKDNDNDSESKENDKGGTDIHVNDENTSQNTELSESQNDDDATEPPIDDISQNIKENDRLDSLDINSEEQNNFSNKNNVEYCTNIDDNENVDNVIENNNDNSTIETPKDDNEVSSVKINGQTYKHDVDNTSDAEMDDKKLMDALDEQIGEILDNGRDNNSENHVNFLGDSVKIGVDVSDTKTEDLNVNNGDLVDKSAVVGDSGLISVDKDKISLDLEPKGHNSLSGMDLDTVSDDELNFDA
ncbi:uncharacterized protein LOC128682280 isoform X2 [Plodia interpunctella]|uniref:uncharacterized protein LOC128682280 isoform X2 n=1 Tax=Plodia interpunctella TaxID=58824 RepID=UPI002367F471|nr:uncharacterized protein LOC128682280 isoform X2 [Plodia interpunctella]